MLPQRAPDPLVDHWVRAGSSGKPGALRRSDSIDSSASNLAKGSSSRHSWLWTSTEGRTLADVLLRLRALPSARVRAHDLMLEFRLLRKGFLRAGHANDANDAVLDARCI